MVNSLKIFLDNYFFRREFVGRKTRRFFIQIYDYMQSLTSRLSPQIVIAKQGPVDDVEEDETCGEEPPGDPVDEDGFLALLLHQVSYLFLPLKLHILDKVLEARIVLVYHIVVGLRGLGRCRNPVVRQGIHVGGS